jgi:hypothetical protein
MTRLTILCCMNNNSNTVATKKYFLAWANFIRQSFQPMACSDGYKTQHSASEFSYLLGKKCSICLLVRVLCDILLHYIFLKNFSN